MKSVRLPFLGLLLVAGMLGNFAPTNAAIGSPWHLAIAHDRQGNVQSGHIDLLISAVRRGCQIRIAWGARRAADPSQTIEHIASPDWVAVRNSQTVEVQLSDFVINLGVLGEPSKDHPRRERFGGTEKAVNWRANLKTDGSFDAVWFDAASGEFIERIPQRHPMKWFVDCPPGESQPLFPSP